MQPAPRSTQIHGKAARIALAVLCAVAVVGLTQCNLASDQVTGVDQARTPPGNCISDCAHRANEEMKRESDLHSNNVKTCRGDKDCTTREQDRHKAAVDQIQDGRKRCMDTCHQQGGGSGR